MKFIFLICLVLGSLNAQTLKFSNGITTSKLHWKLNTVDLVWYDTYISNYSFYFGVDWLQHKSFRFASSVGYLKKGGKDIQIQTDQMGERIGTKSDIGELGFLSLNTTTDVDIPLSRKFVCFFGGGPRFDILVHNDKDFEELKDNHTLNRFTYGLLLEAGIKYQYSKYEIGLKGDYYLNIRQIADWPKTDTNIGGKVTDQTFGLNLVLGYRL